MRTNIYKDNCNKPIRSINSTMRFSKYRWPRKWHDATVTIGTHQWNFCLDLTSRTNGCSHLKSTFPLWKKYSTWKKRRGLICLRCIFVECSDSSPKRAPGINDLRVHKNNYHLARWRSNTKWHDGEWRILRFQITL